MDRQPVSKWRPEVEQLEILEEAFRNHGGNTPSDQHILYLTTQLRRYGMLEPRSVRFWFENRRRRDRRTRIRDRPAVTAPPMTATSITIPVVEAGSCSHLIPIAPAIMDLSTTVSPSAGNHDPVLVTTLGVHNEAGLHYHMCCIFDVMSRMRWHHSGHSILRDSGAGESSALRAVFPQDARDMALSLFPVLAGDVARAEGQLQPGCDDARGDGRGEDDLTLTLGPHD